MATYKGDEGSISRNGVTLGEILSWQISGAAVGVIEDTAKGDVVRTYKAGRKDPGTVAAVVQLDYDSTAQAAWIDAVTDGNSVPSTTVTCTVATGFTFSFTTIPTGFEGESPEGESIARGTLTAKISGPHTIT